MLLLHYHYTSNANLYQTFSMQSCIILIMHDGYPVKAMKEQRKSYIVFQVIRGFRKSSTEKGKGNKNFKVPFFKGFIFTGGLAYTEKNRSFVSTQAFPFRQLTLTLSPTSGDSLRLACFPCFTISRDVFI